MRSFFFFFALYIKPKYWLSFINCIQKEREIWSFEKEWMNLFGGCVCGLDVRLWTSRWQCHSAMIGGASICPNHHTLETQDNPRRSHVCISARRSQLHWNYFDRCTFSPCQSIDLLKWFIPDRVDCTLRVSHDSKINLELAKKKNTMNSIIPL